MKTLRDACMMLTILHMYDRHCKKKKKKKIPSSTAQQLLGSGLGLHQQFLVMSVVLIGFAVHMNLRRNPCAKMLNFLFCFIPLGNCLFFCVFKKKKKT